MRAGLAATLYRMEPLHSPQIGSSIGAGLLLCTASLACLSRPATEAESSAAAGIGARDDPWVLKTTRLGSGERARTRVDLSRGPEPRWSSELPLHLDQVRATADGRAVGIGLRPAPGGAGLADMLELWLVSEQAVASRFDRIPSMPGLDLPWRIPSVRRFEVFDSRGTLLLGLSHRRSTPELESESADPGRRAAQQAGNRGSSSEYWSLYDLSDGRFEREITAAEVFSVQARHVELVDVAPLHAGAVALCTAYTAADLSPGGTVGLCVALLDGDWHTVWQVWMPSRWEGRPGPEAASFDGRDSVVRTLRGAPASGADFQLLYETPGEWVSYVVDLAAGPSGTVRVRECRK